MAVLAAMVAVIVYGPITANMQVSIHILYMSTAVFLITGAGNAINDYFDRDIDAVNRPSRPIPSLRITPQQALGWSLLLFVTGCLASSFINPPCLALAAINTLILILYAGYLKKTPLMGNLCISYLTGSTFLFGALAMGGISGTILVLTLLAALVTAGREIAKDMEDLEGDWRYGAKTLPILMGSKASGYIGAAFVLVAIALSYLPDLGYPYLVAVTLANLLFGLSVRELLVLRPDLAQRYLKKGIGVALAAFLAGSLL